MALFRKKPGNRKGGLVETVVHHAVYMVNIVHDQGPVCVIGDGLDHLAYEPKPQRNGSGI